MEEKKVEGRLVVAGCGADDLDRGGVGCHDHTVRGIEPEGVLAQPGDPESEADKD